MIVSIPNIPSEKNIFVGNILEKEKIVFSIPPNPDFTGIHNIFGYNHEKLPVKYIKIINRIKSPANQVINFDEFVDFLCNSFKPKIVELVLEEAYLPANTKFMDFVNSAENVYLRPFKYIPKWFMLGYRKQALKLDYFVKENRIYNPTDLADIQNRMANFLGNLQELSIIIEAAEEEMNKDMFNKIIELMSELPVLRLNYLELNARSFDVNNLAAYKLIHRLQILVIWETNELLETNPDIFTDNLLRDIGNSNLKVLSLYGIDTDNARKIYLHPHSFIEIGGPEKIRRIREKISSLIILLSSQRTIAPISRLPSELIRHMANFLV